MDYDQPQPSTSTGGVDREPNTTTSPTNATANQILWQTTTDPTSGGQPTLNDAQLAKISECAGYIGVQLKQYEPKLVQNKKRISPELLRIIHMAPNEPGRLDHFRRYAAIYGRFDAKRKHDKALTLHEVSVNEAAAQICLYRPALLTRRDELFPLARQCVKDAGYHYVKGTKRATSDNDVASPAGGSSDRHKRSKRSSPAESMSSCRSQTPSSCAGPEDTPPPTQVQVRRNTSEQSFTTSHTAINLAMPTSTTALALPISHIQSAPNLATRQPMNIEQVGGAWTVVKREPSSSSTSSNDKSPSENQPAHSKNTRSASK